MGCFKVCTEISIDKNIYIVNQKLFSTLKYILTLQFNNNNKNEFEFNEEGYKSQSKNITLFSYILTKISNKQKIEIFDNGI